MDQTNLFENMVKFNYKSRPGSKNKNKKRNTSDNVSGLYESREISLNASSIGTFPIKETQWKGPAPMLASRYLDLATQLKVLSPKEILQTLPVSLAQVSVGNTPGNLLN